MTRPIWRPLALIYALLSAMSLAIFFVKYRIEYVFVLPAIAVLFGKYLALSMQPASTAAGSPSGSFVKAA